MSGWTNIENAAVKWWHGKRPVGWGISEHLAQPCVNCSSAWETHLAETIVEEIKRRKNPGDRILD